MGFVAGPIPNAMGFIAYCEISQLLKTLPESYKFLLKKSGDFFHSGTGSHNMDDKKDVILKHKDCNKQHKCAKEQTNEKGKDTFP